MNEQGKILGERVKKIKIKKENTTGITQPTAVNRYFQRGARVAGGWLVAAYLLAEFFFTYRFSQ